MKAAANLREKIRQIVPLALRRPIVQWKVRKEEASGAHFCPVCQSTVRQFVPHGNPTRADELCPVCQSKSCHRLAWAYFARHPEHFRMNGHFLHIAPEFALGKWLKKRCAETGMTYRSGDIRDRKHPIDIQASGIPAASLDVVFANHVLNMVPDDRRAMNEIRRILKPSGLAIVPVPLDVPGTGMKEVAPDSTADERVDKFNDAAMFRAYTGAEYTRRLRAAGLEPSEFRPVHVPGSEADSWMLLDDCVYIAVAV